MELQNNQLQDLRDGFTSLGSLTEDRDFVAKLLDKNVVKADEFFKFSYNIGKTLRRVKEPLDELNKAKRRVFNQYAEKVGDKTAIPIGKQEAYDAAIKAINDEIINLDITKVKLSFLSKINVGGLVLASIAPVVDEDVDL